MIIAGRLDLSYDNPPNTFEYIVEIEVCDGVRTCVSCSRLLSLCRPFLHLSARRDTSSFDISSCSNDGQVEVNMPR